MAIITGTGVADEMTEVTAP